MKKVTKTKTNTKTQRSSAVKPTKAPPPKKATVTDDTAKAAAAVLKKFGTAPIKVKDDAAIAKDGTIKIQVGPYGTETVANQECDQFRHPEVFAQRSALFPLPSSYGVKVEILESKVVTAVNKNPLNPYKVELTLKVNGPVEKAQAWVTSLRNRVRGIPG